jgi:RNA polymerase sigma factor (sigma-70 family)
MKPNELFQLYYQDVYRTCYYMLRNCHDAEDVCQDVFFKALQQEYHRITSLKPWILSISMNACRNHIRKHSRVQTGNGIINWLIEAIDPRRVEEQLESKEQKEHLSFHIQRLNPKIREVIVLKYLHELKNEEIAEALRIPLGTVKSRANKGLVQLRMYLTDDPSPGNKHSHRSQTMEVPE